MKKETKNHIKESRFVGLMVHWIDKLVSLLMLLSTVAVVMFVCFEVFHLFEESLRSDAKMVLRSVAIIIILVKAHRLLIYYMQRHHVSIRYIIEISIIAPSVELIFTPESRPLSLNILYAVFALVSLVVYLMLGSKIDELDTDKADAESAD